jgi:acyl-CoA thioesterase-1
MKGFQHFVRFAIALTAAITVAMTGPTHAQNAGSDNGCVAPADLTRLESPLSRVGLHIAAGRPLKIVAIGSSSTFGAGASSPAMSYPSRLEAELRRLVPAVPITVVNRGVNGENAKDMLERFNRDVFAENPDLVLWQVGSNAVLQDLSVQQAGTPLHVGLQRLRAADIDVVLINPQYAPKVIAKKAIEEMIDLIGNTAREMHVDLFQRFAVMRNWRVTRGVPFSAFLSEDKLHMNDWGYGCVAQLLAGAIHDAATRPATTAVARVK